jgi:hypothetical protein
MAGFAAAVASLLHMRTIRLVSTWASRAREGTMITLHQARFAAFAVALAACTKSEQPAPAPAASAPAQAAAAAAAPAVKKPVFEEATFKLALSGEPTYTAGQPGTLKLVLDARGGYHVNQEYPIRIDLKAPAAVKLAKASLARPDAKAFTDVQAAFETGFTAEAGTHEIIADVDFAVCTPETCVPDQRTLALSIDVK